MSVPRRVYLLSRVLVYHCHHHVTNATFSEIYTTPKHKLRAHRIWIFQGVVLPNIFIVSGVLFGTKGQRTPTTVTTRNGLPVASMLNCNSPRWRSAVASWGSPIALAQLGNKCCTEVLYACFAGLFFSGENHEMENIYIYIFLSDRSPQSST